LSLRILDFRRRCLPLVLRYQLRISDHFVKLDPHYGDQFLHDYNQLDTPQTHPRAYGESFRAANFHYHSTHCPFRENFTRSSAGYYRDGAQSLQNSKIKERDGSRPIIDRKSFPSLAGGVRRTLVVSEDNRLYPGIQDGSRGLPALSSTFSSGTDTGQVTACHLANAILLRQRRRAERHKPGKGVPRSMDTCRIS